MDNTQCGITVLYRVHNDTHGKQIVNLVDGLVLVLHFFVNAEEMLDPAVDFRLDAGIFNMLLYFLHNIFNVFFPLALPDRNLFHQIVVGFRL